MSKKIVVVGSCNIDMVTYASRFPEHFETMYGTNFATNFGGKGANQAVGIGKLGGNVSFVGRLGDDAMANAYLEEFKKCGIDTKYLKKTEGVPNGTATIVVAEGGGNFIIIIGGANQKISLDDIKEAEETIKQADVLLCQLEIPEACTIAALELNKGTTILNAAPAVENANPKLLTLPTIFCVNEIEAGTFSDVKVINVEDAKKAIDVLLDKGCNSVLLTLGKQGAVYASKENRKHICVQPPNVNAIDSTGAGDLFVGAFAYLLANKPEMGIENIMKAACVIAADSVTRLGTQISYPGPDILNHLDGTLSQGVCKGKKRPVCNLK